MGRVVNLDEAKIAAAEDGPPTVILGGVTYTLPNELPLDVAIDIKNEDLAGVVEALFGKDAGKVRKAGLSVQDFDRIARGAYGLGEGESGASAG